MGQACGLAAAVFFFFSRRSLPRGQAQQATRLRSCYNSSSVARYTAAGWSPRSPSAATAHTQTDAARPSPALHVTASCSPPALQESALAVPSCSFASRICRMERPLTTACAQNAHTRAASNMQQFTVTAWSESKCAPWPHGRGCPEPPGGTRHLHCCMWQAGGCGRLVSHGSAHTNTAEETLHDDAERQRTLVTVTSSLPSGSRPSELLSMASRDTSLPAPTAIRCCAQPAPGAHAAHCRGASSVAAPAAATRSSQRH